MKEQIMISLVRIDRRPPWLAEQLGMSRSTFYRKLEKDRWEYRELKRMKEIFRWKTLEG